MPGDTYPATGRRQRGGQDRDRGGFAGTVRSQQGKQLAALHVERDAVDGIGVGALVAFD
jgi:hypothetical protein